MKKKFDSCNCHLTVTTVIVTVETPEFDSCLSCLTGTTGSIGNTGTTDTTGTTFTNCQKTGRLFFALISIGMCYWHIRIRF
jgi:hypothetical protein